MKAPIGQTATAQVFTEARSHHFWTKAPVSDEQLQALYELLKWGPTAVNANPVRILFIKSDEQKEKLYPALMGSNIEQVKSAPVTAIVAYDEKFYEHLPILFPAFDAKPLYINNPALSHETAFRNSSLQGAYMIMAARSLGFDTCPMSGFNNAEVDKIFFAGTTWKSNFICTIGVGDESKVYPRGPRLSFEQACKIV